MLRVAVTGPESTGKTTLCQDLAQHYNALWAPEYARTYLEELQAPYDQEDLLKMAKGHVHAQEALIAQHPEARLLVTDTEMLVMHIWSQHSYQQTHPWITAQMQQQPYDLYLLTNIDLPWQPDPLREHPELRAFFFNWYEKELKQRGWPYVVISGNNAASRLQMATNAIDKLL